jgi:hypothetical protein
VRYNSFSNEESCGKAIPREKYILSCLRTMGHDGECVPEAGKAGEADGVRWCCRVKLEQPHASWCLLPRRETDDCQDTDDEES